MSHWTNIAKQLIIERYNSIMITIGRECLTIGLNVSEGTEHWNLRDMVAECDYQLSTFHECGHYNHQLKKDAYPVWLRETKTLKHFIDQYKDVAMNIECYEAHSSQYD